MTRHQITLLPGQRDLAVHLVEEHHPVTLPQLLSRAAWLGIQLLAGRVPTLPTREQDLARLASLRERPTLAAAYRRAVQRFSLAQQGLAIAYAARWQTESIPQEDLEQQAMIGLLEAVHAWDPGRGTCFSTFAMFKMRHTLQRYVQKKEVPVHTPQTVLDDQRRLRRAHKVLVYELQRDPTAAELCVAAGLTPERYARAAQQLTFVPYEENRER